MIPPDLSPAARKGLVAEATRRSLGLFHREAFRMLHGEAMIPGNHVDAMVYQLERLARGEIRKLLITLPPRHGKSELVSGSFPAWIVGNDPGTKVMVVSYGQDLSEPLVDRARTIIKHPSYGRLFPGTRILPGKDRKDHFAFAGGGSIRATSKGGAITGLGGHFLIVDDFHKAGESMSPGEREKAIDLFQSTFVNRFENLNDTRMVIVMQRLHEEDLAGWAIASGGWHHLNLPAYAEQDETIPVGPGKSWYRKKGEVLAPALASSEFLEEQRRIMGPRHYGAQFQQNPVVADGGQIDLNWFDQYDERPERNFFHKVVQSIDAAATDRATSDYSVGHCWGYHEGSWYLLDVFRVQESFVALTDRVMAWHHKWRADALIIEHASVGIALYDHAKRLLPGLIRAPTPRGSKLDRLAGCTVELQSGSFLLPASADWLPTLRHEWLAFPDGRNDDHVDALTQFVEFSRAEDRWLATRYDRNGRPLRGPRPARKPRFYGGNIPSAGSWQDDPSQKD